jgi:alpha-beta hydrolase superfamily lysophospholipase
MRTADGVDLYVRDWPVPAGTRRRGAALIVHGLGEHSGRYDHVAAALNASGIAVRSYDHRGFGQSGGGRGVIPNEAAFLDDAKLVFDAFATEARASGDAELPFLIGHSMGGAVAARAVTGRWITPGGLVLSSPALKLWLSAKDRWRVRLGTAFAPNRARPHGLPLGEISHDEDVLIATKNDPFCHDRISPRVVSFLVDAGLKARRAASRIEIPTLLLISGDDRIVDAEGAREFARAMPSGRVTLHEYEDLYHEVFNEREPDRARVLSDLRDWIEQHTGRGGA